MAQYSSTTLHGNWFEDRAPPLKAFEKTAEDRDFTTTHATGFRAPQRVAKRAERSMLDFQRYTEVPATKLVNERGFAVMSGVQAIDGTVDYTSTAQRAGVGCYAPGAAAPKESQMQRQAKLAKAAGVDTLVTKVDGQAPPPFAVYE